MTPCADRRDALFAEFAGALAPTDRDALRGHVRGCAACRAAWDRLAEAEAFALGAGRHTRAFARLVEAGVIEAAGEAPRDPGPSVLEGPTRVARPDPNDAPSGAPRHAPRPGPSRVVRRLAAVGGALALAASALVWLRASPPSGPALVARGDDQAPPDREALTFRLLRVRSRDGVVTVDDLGSGGALEVGDTIVPLVSNLAAGPRRVSLWAARGDEAPSPLEPEAGAQSARVADGVEDHRLAPVEVPAAWAGEDVTVWAVFDPSAEVARVRPPELDGLLTAPANRVSSRKLSVRVRARGGGP